MGQGLFYFYLGQVASTAGNFAITILTKTWRRVATSRGKVIPNVLPWTGLREGRKRRGPQQAHSVSKERALRKARRGLQKQRAAVNGDALKVQSTSFSLPLNSLPHYSSLEVEAVEMGVKKEKERKDGGCSLSSSLVQLQGGLRRDRTEVFDGWQVTILIETRLELKWPESYWIFPRSS